MTTIKLRWRPMIWLVFALLVITTMLNITRYHLEIALLLGAHQTAWLLVTIALLLVAIKLLLHHHRPHAKLATIFLKQAPTLLELGILLVIGILTGTIIDLLI